MSNIEVSPDEIQCTRAPSPVDDAGRSKVEVLSSRQVPLGGPRAMTVRRTLPQRARSLIGGWCFVDHYGPDDVTVTGGMDVPPHPHTGLQTVSWLFSGAIEHRDSHRVHATVRPGEMNLMTGGHGICHSEVSTPTTTIVHGVQLWIALPDHARRAARDFQHYVPPTQVLEQASVRVFLGSLAGHTSPVDTFTPLLGAEVTLQPQATLSLTVEPSFEHGVLVDTGTVALVGTDLHQAELGYLGPGHTSVVLTNPADDPARVLLVGGEPFAEEIVMWWNFVGRSHDEIVGFRKAWESESERFGRVEGYAGSPSRLPAPPLPQATLKPRGNPPAGGSR